jgi:hypothetical protein
LAPATHTIFLWITDRGFAPLPAFFTTIETLSLSTVWSLLSQRPNCMGETHAL